MDRIVPARTHVVVWLVLLALAGLNVALAYAKLGVWNAVVALLIAAVQAALIAAFLMHLRWSSGLVRVVALATLFWVAILIGGTMDDQLTRGWLQNVR